MNNPEWDVVEHPETQEHVVYLDLGDESCYLTKDELQEMVEAL
jgi:hypothetical protein